jgi:hypothetical protein
VPVFLRNHVPAATVAPTATRPALTAQVNTPIIQRTQFVKFFASHEPKHCLVRISA